jgi:hypothetical protein
MWTTLERYVRNMSGRSFGSAEIPDGFKGFGDVIRMVEGAEIRKSDGVSPWLRFEWDDAMSLAFSECMTG